MKTAAGAARQKQIPNLTIGLARLHELTATPRNKTAAEFFWTRVVKHHSYVIGGNSEGEHIRRPELERPPGSKTRARPATPINMLKLTRHLHLARVRE